MKQQSALPQPLDYSSQEQPASNWPIGWYFAALVWAFVTLELMGLAQESYRADAVARARTQVPLLCLAAGRLIWARLRRERSKGWIFYLAILILAAPIWELIAKPIAAFARTQFGGPLVP